MHRILFFDWSQIFKMSDFPILILTEVQQR